MGKTLAQGKLVAIIAGVAILGVVGVAETQVFPKRFAVEGGSEPLVAVAVTEILDPFVQKVTASAGIASNASDTVPLAEIARRCGDEDGCRLRLISRLAGPGANRADAIETRVFSTDPSGVEWVVNTDDGAEKEGGSLTDASIEIVFTICSGCFECTFREENGSPDYELEVWNSLFFPDPYECLLRVDD